MNNTARINSVSRHTDTGNKQQEREECGMDVTQASMEAAIAKSEVAHLNAKRIQDEIEDVKHELREDDVKMFYPGCGGVGEGLLFGLLAGGGYGWGGKGHGCGGHGGHCDTIEILRDNHDGVLSIKDQINNNAIHEADVRHEDAMDFQKGLDCNKLATVEAACKIERDMACGFAAVTEKLNCMEKDDLKRDLCACKEKVEELKSKLSDQTQTQTILDAIAAISTTA